MGMSLSRRTAWVPIPDRLKSSYPIAPTGLTPRASLKPLCAITDSAPADVVEALVELDAQVRSAGGDLRITELGRDFQQQAVGRKKFEAWDAAGRPRPGTAGFDAKTMKAAFVAQPGYSGHNARRSIDVHIAALRFPGVPAAKQLDALWEIAIPLGFSPIIRAPDESASESWHFDCWGEWAHVKERRGYSEACMAMCLDAGLGDGLYPQAPQRALQAQLHRVGQDIGAIDGVIGQRTLGALKSLGLPPTATAADLFVLPTSKYNVIPVK